MNFTSYAFSSRLQCQLQFSCTNDLRFIFTSIYFVGVSCFIYVISIYLHILVSNTIFISDDCLCRFISNTTGVTSGIGSTNPSEAPFVDKFLMLYTTISINSLRYQTGQYYAFFCCPIWLVVTQQQKTVLMMFCIKTSTTNQLYKQLRQQ